MGKEHKKHNPLAAFGVVSPFSRGRMV